MNRTPAFTLTIDPSGSAFADDETGEVDAYSASREISRILRTAADEVAAGRLADTVDVPADCGRWLRDENGNKVGNYALDFRPALADLELPELLDRLGIRVEFGEPEEIRESTGRNWITRHRYSVQLIRKRPHRATARIEFTCGEGVEPTAADVVSSIVLDQQYLEDDGGDTLDGMTLREAVEMAQTIERNTAWLETLIRSDDEREAITEAAGNY